MGTRTQYGASARPPRTAQGGIVIVEVLLAVLIFSFGILGVIKLQANAIKFNADAKLRSDASYLAGQIISQMWIDRASLATYSHHAGGSGCTFSGAAGTSANVTSWVGRADQRGTVLGSLPNASSQIQVDTVTKLVTVTVCWRAPQETETHNVTSTALIAG